MTTNVLVTGGAGFIGSNFVRHMLNKYPEYKIINVDMLTYAGNLANLRDIETDADYIFHKADIADHAAMDAFFADYSFEYVVNFAAESHVDRSIEEPEKFIRTNIMGTQVLLDQAKKYGVKKYLQVSTDEVYGALGAEGLFTEETPIAPNSPYSASKAGADLMVRAYYETFGLPVNITRCSNNYGPYHFPEKLIPLMVTNALENKELPVYGDGLHVRDWLHVSDHCQAIDQVLHRGSVGEVYNIGGNNEKTNIEIVRNILAALGKPDTLIRYVKDRPGHDRRYGIDATKIKRELGWKPLYTFEQGLIETVAWYQEHADWWRAIKSGEYREYYKKMYAKR
ncbi:MAG TPA: dTDP-glucose 4,6-dehydratase [Methylomusa anaerophila]|uniref:dTDP-glucose 4,6-dehydratase n=1 Tax=Methylomusa anaerophila TaxID=1930071 RepID=A0A348AKM3_9FIRM|nr:dTDP-glucose 4,6-dehydratase [Methylomusa anaerophila]BBB91621.1 dTDP-glucose 4,6-dehydratase [Methylomusa anaerophila]HML89441.1 dTDP-glucose 4,6-dehydratase [Methylomusa anaerophila]